jgi:hypothetical protein
MRMSFSESLPSKRISACLLLFWLSGSVYLNVAWQTMIGGFDTAPPHPKATALANIFKGGYVPKDTYVLDEIIIL